jgi:hypothetical protein
MTVSSSLRAASTTAVVRVEPGPSSTFQTVSVAIRERAQPDQQLVLTPAEFVQPVLGDSEVVRHLVHHGHRDLVHQLLLIAADIE